VLGVIVAFAILFQLTQTNAKSFWDPLYFSFVTFTTLGYGDIVPISGIAKLLVILESFAGYIMGGLLVAILARKVMGR
jgi:voltage-gated potassium channel Kch